MGKRKLGNPKTIEIQELFRQSIVLEMILSRNQ